MSPTTRDQTPHDAPDGDGLATRLTRDEARLTVDEARLRADEALIAVDEEAARSTRRLSITGIAIGVVLLVATVALVVAIVALHRDVHAIEVSAPAGSVATGSLRDGAVTADKLAAGSVTRAAIAPGAVGAQQLAPDAVGSPAVGPNALGGADIRESTLSPVPQASDARRLGGAAASAYLAHLRVVRASTELSTAQARGPVRATCPDGATVVSGGAAVEGALSGVSIASSTAWEHGWTATAHRSGRPDNAWRLVVTAICAVGGD